MNVYLEAGGSKGLKYVATTATGCAHNIDGKPGKRLVIRSFGVTVNGATAMAFMMGLRSTTVAAAGGASGATTITTAAWSTAPATSGYVVVVLDDGTYQFTTVASTASTTSLPIASKLTDDATEGNPIYYLGLWTDDDQMKYLLTGGSQTTVNLDNGIWWGAGKGYPARVELVNAGASGATSAQHVDYVTYAYVNK